MKFRKKAASVLFTAAFLAFPPSSLHCLASSATQLVAALSVSASDSSRQAPPAALVGRDVCALRPFGLALPVSLIAAGTWGLCNGAWKKMNRGMRDGMTDLRQGCFIHADDYLQYVPVTVHLGLGLAGVPARHSFRDRTLAAANAFLCMGLVVNTVKYTVRERRPDSSARNSFPSGHTATVFTGAELVRLEYGGALGAGAYSLALGVSFLRMYNNRHWFNDVVAGAGVGILSARLGYWLLPLEQRLFRKRESVASSAVFMPFYAPNAGAWGGSLAVRF